MATTVTTTNPRAGDPSARPVVQFARDFVLGSSVAAIGKTAGAPFQRRKLLLASTPLCRSPIAPRLGVLRRVVAEEGLAALWRGNCSNLLRYAPVEGLVLAANDRLNAALSPYDARTDFWRSFATKLFCGGLAGAAASALTHPLDAARWSLVSARYSAQPPANVYAALSQLGFGQAYAGWGIAVASAAVLRAGQLGGFKQIQERSSFAQDKGWRGVVSTLAAALTASTAVMPLYLPLATLRQRLMVLPAATRPHVLPLVALILRQEGVRGLYGGFLRVMDTVRFCFGGSVVITGYDRIKVICSL